MHRRTERAHWRRWRGVGALLLVGGCAGLGVKTEGTSGPLAWRVTDLRVETRQRQEGERDVRAFTLVIRNISDRTLTLTKMDQTSGQPGTGTRIASYPVQWELRPGAERKISRSWSLVCRDRGGCTDTGGAQPMFQIDFVGVDDQNRPIQVRLDITLPPQGMGRAPIVR